MKKSKNYLKNNLLDNNKSGYKTKKSYLLKNFPDTYDNLEIFVKENNLNTLPFKEQLYLYLNDMKSVPLCPICKNKLKLKSPISEGYQQYCSLKCCNSSNDHIEKIKKNNIKKFGGVSPMNSIIISNKIKKTNFKKYGVSNIFQDTKYIKSKTIEKYGIDHISKLESTKNKIKKTNLNKYNVTTPLLLRSSRNKLSEKNLKSFKEKYNHLNIVSINNDNIKIKCNICNKTYIINRTVLFHRNKITNNPCTFCHPIKNGTSIGENEISEFLKKINIPHEINNRKILNGQEVDIFSPEKRIAIEYNGLFWHNELFCDKNYHLNKTENCLQNNIKLIHIFEDEWLYKKEIVKSRLKNIFGLTENKIYARKCIVKEISNEECKIFLNNNHIQGHINSKYKIGLYFENLLVSVMTFGNLRKSLGFKSTNNIFEMLRFCNLLNTTVVGGASKLLKFFIKKYFPNEIISFADRRWSDGNLYKNLNFYFVKNTQPNYFYIINSIRENRFKYRKDILVKEGFDKNLTEHKIMLERKIYRIYDSGSILFRMKIN